jgi:hypothetical protein
VKGFEVPACSSVGPKGLDDPIPPIDLPISAIDGTPGTRAGVKLTDSVFSRYNIGSEKDVEAARKALEQFHKQAQRKRK